jgi:hypothetical protein
MLRRAVPGTIALLAVAAAFPAVAKTPAVVTPVVGGPDTAFHAEIPALYKIKQIRDRYWFVVTGPGGLECETLVTDRVGVTPPRRAKVVEVDLAGVRVANSEKVVPGPWCPGTFSGRVEYRDYQPKRHRIVRHHIGPITFRVEAAQ